MKLIGRLDKAHNTILSGIDRGWTTSGLTSEEMAQALICIAGHYPKLRAVVLLARKVIDTDALDTHPLELEDELIDALKALDEP